MRGRVGWGTGRARVWACVSAFCSLRGLFPSLSLLLSFCLLVLLFFWGGGWLGCGVFRSLRGCRCVPVPVLVWAWVLRGNGVGWLLRSEFPVCAPTQGFRFPGRQSGGC